MTHAEFCAWLTGYLDGCGDKPDTAAIRAKLGEVKAAPVAPVVVPAADLQWRPSPFQYPPYTTCRAVSPDEGTRAASHHFARLGADFEAVWDANTDKLWHS